MEELEERIKQLEKRITDLENKLSLDESMYGSIIDSLEPLGKQISSLLVKIKTYNHEG